MGITVLIVDDDSNLLMAYQTALQATCADLEITTTSDRLGLLTQLTQQNFDALIFNYHLTQDSGLELLQIVKDSIFNQAQHKIPMAVISADSRITEKASDIQPDAVIVKASLEETVQDIMQFLNAHFTLTDQTKSYSQQLEKLKMEFIRNELPAELEKLEQLIKRVNTSPTDKSLIESLFQVSHALKGSTGAYKLSGLSEAISTIADCCRTEPGQPSYDVGPFLPKIYQAWHTIQANAQQFQAGLGRELPRN